MRYGTLLGGRDTLGGGGRAGYFGKGVSSNTSCWVWPVETGSRAGRELGCVALMLVTAGVTTGGTRYLVFTVVMFKCMEGIVGPIHCCCW